MINASVVPLLDALDAVFAGGNNPATGAAAAVPGTDGRLKPILTNTAGTIWVVQPTPVGDLGVGAFRRGLGWGSERTRAGKKVRLKVSRYENAAADTYKTMTGSFAIYGCNLPEPLGGKVVGNDYDTDQSDTHMVFKTGVEIALSGSATFDASSLGTAAFNADAKGYNWVVVLNGNILPYAAAKLDNNVSWSINAGVVTLRAANATTTVPAGSDLVVYKLATADVTELLAAGLHTSEDTQITSKTIIWPYFTTNVLATNRTLVTISSDVE
jgi:hypothetical protein